jgi:hypothetical protein
MEDPVAAEHRRPLIGSTVHGRPRVGTWQRRPLRAEHGKPLSCGAEHGRPLIWWQSLEDLEVAEHSRPDGGAEHGIGGRARKTSCWQSMEDSLMVNNRRNCT